MLLCVSELSHIDLVIACVSPPDGHNTLNHTLCCRINTLFVILGWGGEVKGVMAHSCFNICLQCYVSPDKDDPSNDS